MLRFILVPVFGILTLSLAPPPAHAQLGAPWNSPSYSVQRQSSTVWRQMTLCAQQAQKQFPDHTPEGNAKREQARLNCERQYHLPVDPGIQRRF
jgi:hypothetical protein